RGGQMQEPDAVGDRRPGPDGPGRELRLCHVELVEKLLEERRLLERVELDPMDILQQGVPEEILVLGLADDGGNAVQRRLLAGPSTALAHDQLVWTGGQRPGASSRTTIGWRRPNSLTEWVSSARASSSNCVRGCLGFGSISAGLISRYTAPGSTNDVVSRETVSSAGAVSRETASEAAPGS